MKKKLKMFKELFSIFFIINISSSSGVIQSLYEAGQQVWKLYTIINNRKLEIAHNSKTPQQLDDNPMIQELKKQVGIIQAQLNELEKSMVSKRIRESIKSWRIDAQTIRDIDVIDLLVSIIDEYYDKFNRYRSGCAQASFEILMEDIVPAVEGDMLAIRKCMMMKQRSHLNIEDLVASLTNYAVAHSADICGAPQVISHILIQLFQMILIAEFKTSTVMAYHHIHGYVKSADKGGWGSMNLWGEFHFERHFADYVNMFSSNIGKIDGTYNRVCDPPSQPWIRDEFFYELEATFQAIIFGYNWSNCKFKSCNDVMIERFRECPPSFYQNPVSTSLEDIVTECAYLGRIEACALDSAPQKFLYVNSTELGFLGPVSTCPDDYGKIIKSSTTATGTYAACACNYYNSRNKISLSMMESDVKANRIITGLRFVYHSNILHIQPREATLKSNGYINESSQNWIIIPKNINNLVIEPINQYNRVFFLDDLILPANYVFTGIKFNKVIRENVPGFAIEIFGNQFDYKSGKLSIEENFRRSLKESNDKAGNMLFFNPLSSVFTTETHKITSSDIKYVSLKRSTLEDDFGQSTLPLFDALPIMFDVPSALGGVGIFHKGVDDYAGLISLRVYGIKYYDYFNDFKLAHDIDDRVLFDTS